MRALNQSEKTTRSTFLGSNKTQSEVENPLKKELVDTFTESEKGYIDNMIETVEADYEDGKTCCGLIYQPEAEPINFICLCMAYFVAAIGLNVAIICAPFILTDPEYYDVPQEKLASTTGDISAYSELVLVGLQAFLGILFDVAGRRWPLVIGVFILTVGFGAIPLANEVYPWFLIFRVLLGIGFAFIINVPLLGDYIHRKSLGRAQAIIGACMSIAQAASSAGFL